MSPPAHKLYAVLLPLLSVSLNCDVKKAKKKQQIRENVDLTGRHGRGFVVVVFVLGENN